jgi:hypothetical protein
MVHNLHQVTINSQQAFPNKTLTPPPLPYPRFMELLQEAKKSPLFKAWHDSSSDFTIHESPPLELMVLGCLRYLGRGWTFDDLKESTEISEETHRR